MSKKGSITLPASATRKAKETIANTDNETVFVGFSFLDPNKYNFNSFEVFNEFIKFAQKIEQHTWLQVKKTAGTPGNKTGFGCILRKTPPLELPAKVSPDETILELRMSEKQRVFGFRQGRVFQIVWVDPNHKL